MGSQSWIRYNMILTAKSLDPMISSSTSASPHPHAISSCISSPPCSVDHPACLVGPWSSCGEEEPRSVGLGWPQGVTLRKGVRWQTCDKVPLGWGKRCPGWAEGNEAGWQWGGRGQGEARTIYRMILRWGVHPICRWRSTARQGLRELPAEHGGEELLGSIWGVPPLLSLSGA